LYFSHLQRKDGKKEEFSVTSEDELNAVHILEFCCFLTENTALSPFQIPVVLGNINVYSENDMECLN
jgi:hypothetical protein